MQSSTVCPPVKGVVRIDNYYCRTVCVPIDSESSVDDAKGTKYITLFYEHQNVCISLYVCTHLSCNVFFNSISHQ